MGGGTGSGSFYIETCDAPENKFPVDGKVHLNNDRGTFMPEIVNEFLILTKGNNKINKADFGCLFVC